MLGVLSFLWFMIIFCAGLFIHNKNAVNSIVFLIATFFFAAINIYLLGAHFLGLTLLIVYVGAIAVLFIFVIMMVNIKEAVKAKDEFGLKFIFSKFSIYIVSFFAVYGLLYFLYSNENVINTFKDITIYSTISFTDLLMLEVMGQALFRYFLFSVIIAGTILLVALVGVIILVVNLNKLEEKNNKVNKQLSRADKFISNFKNKK